MNSILVRLPNWIGDVVMATPLLAGLRLAFPDARITIQGRPHLLSILAGAEWFDEAIPVVRSSHGLGAVRMGLELRGLGHDLALLLPNSFSSALSARVAGIPRRVGYAADARSFLLTDALYVEKVSVARNYTRLMERGAEGVAGQGGEGLREWMRRKSGPKLRSVSMVDYYLRLGEHVGMPSGSVPRRPMLPITAEARESGIDSLRRLGLEPTRERIVVFNTGAAYGSAKLWLDEYWVEIGDRLMATDGVRILLLCGPGDEERRSAELAGRMKGPAVSTAGNVVSLDKLGGMLFHCAMMITTDSGPRHFGVAAGLPVVVLVGSTDPAYTECDYDKIEILLEKVECWPCHLRTCPIDHRCMVQLTPDKVMAAARGFLGGADGVQQGEASEAETE